MSICNCGEDYSERTSQVINVSSTNEWYPFDSRYCVFEQATEKWNKIKYEYDQSGDINNKPCPIN